MNITEKKIRFLGIPLLGVLIPLLIKPETYWKECSFGTHIAISTFFCFVMWNGSALIFFYLHEKYPHHSQFRKRIVCLITYWFLFTILAGTLLSISIHVLGIVSTESYTFDKWLFTMKIDLSISALVMSIYESAYLFEKWKASAVEAERLKTQNIRSQLEVLKTQVSPHFLFNSLNTLVSLIPENPDLAVEFTQKLSQVYRYILQNKDKELVRLETELHFAKSYIFLLKTRFGENIKVNYQIDEKYLNDFVAPLTLQMLIENAVKHNIVSTDKPLTIDISVDKGTCILVKNNLQEKQSAEPSTKIGLQNIIKRYKYLSNQAVDVLMTSTGFVVSLPLIKVNEGIM
jgi:two-component system, LytTR family, sensor kinase